MKAFELNNNKYKYCDWCGIRIRAKMDIFIEKIENKSIKTCSKRCLDKLKKTSKSLINIPLPQIKDNNINQEVIK